VKHFSRKRRKRIPPSFARATAEGYLIKEKEEEEEEEEEEEDQEESFYADESPRTCVIRILKEHT